MPTFYSTRIPKNYRGKEHQAMATCPQPSSWRYGSLRPSVPIIHSCRQRRLAPCRTLAMTMAETAVAPTFPVRFTRPRTSLFVVGAGGHDGFERLQHFSHVRPVLRLRLDTSRHQPSRCDDCFAREPALQPLVHDADHLPAIAEHRLDPLDQAVLPARPVQVQRPLSRHHLQQHHPEPVDIAFHIQMPCTSAIRCHHFKKSLDQMYYSQPSDRSVRWLRCINFSLSIEKTCFVGHFFPLIVFMGLWQRTLLVRV